MIFSFNELNDTFPVVYTNITMIPWCNKINNSSEEEEFQSILCNGGCKLNRLNDL